jgi:threonine dehydrogenase-like Zn-dependent dehydrogenase
VRAVVLTGDRTVEVEQVDDPVLPGPRGAVVEVERTAICGSDLHLYHGGMGTGVHLGHEFVDRVLEVGSEVLRFGAGDRILVSGVIGCGRCQTCRSGVPGNCEANRTAVFGSSASLPGGQAEAVAVPEVDEFALAIPEGLSVESAVLLTDILPTGYLGAQRARIAPGATVVLFGLGPVGVMALQSAQLFGPARILAVDREPSRLARGAELGAEVIDASGGDAVAQVLEATKGRGAASVIEAVGADQTVSDAIACAAPGGTVSVVGVNLNPAFPYPMGLALLRSLTLSATLAAIPATWPTLVPLLDSGRLTPDAVFTHRLWLSEAPHAYQIFDARQDGVLKVLLDPKG